MRKGLKRDEGEPDEDPDRVRLLNFFLRSCFPERSSGFRFLDLANDGVEIRPFAGLEFGVEEFAIGADFEGAAARWNEGERRDPIAELENFSRQTDGFRCVVSNAAILDPDFGFHRSLLSPRSYGRGGGQVAGRERGHDVRSGVCPPATARGSLGRDGVGGALAGVGVEDALAQAEGLRRHFHVLIRSDVLDRTLQGHL